MPVLPRADVDRALAADLIGWSVTDDGSSITREVRAATFLDGISLVQRVAEAAEARDHHPDVDIRFRTLRFTVSTHSAGGLTVKDLDLAAEIDRLAAG